MSTTINLKTRLACSVIHHLSLPFQFSNTTITLSPIRKHDAGPQTIAITSLTVFHHASQRFWKEPVQGADQDSSGTSSLEPPGLLMLTLLQKTKADAKATATPTKTKTPIKTATKQTPKKEEPKKEEPKPVTPKKPKAAAKYSKLARNDKATLPIEVTFQGDILQAKRVKANYTHAIKFDAATAFTLVDTVSLHLLCFHSLSLTLSSTLSLKASNMRATKSSSSSRPRPSSS